jgi:hypothetical protein
MVLGYKIICVHLDNLRCLLLSVNIFSLSELISNQNLLIIFSVTYTLYWAGCVETWYLLFNIFNLVPILKIL